MADNPIVSTSTGYPIVDTATGYPQVSAGGTKCCCTSTPVCTACLNTLVGDVPSSLTVVVSGMIRCDDLHCDDCLQAYRAIGTQQPALQVGSGSPNGAFCLTRAGTSCSWTTTFSIDWRSWGNLFPTATCGSPNTALVYTEGVITLSSSSGGGTTWSLTIQYWRPGATGLQNLFSGTFTEDTDNCQPPSFTNTFTSCSVLSTGDVEANCIRNFFVAGGASVSFTSC